MRDNWTSTETEDYPQESPEGPSIGGAGWSPGSVIAGRYRIVSLLGRGGMGDVYRAEDLELSETVALKFLSEEWAGSPERLARLRQEVKLSRRVTHANVCRVFDLASAEGRTFLSMEWVDGEDLASLLRRIGHLPQAKVLEVAHQLCIGLAAAHAAGILHRDLKPANVMLDSQGRVRIMDFGLALESVPDSLGDVRDGTPAYMSPEQLRGDEVSERSDLFALGALLYESTSGTRPFDAKTLEAWSTRQGPQRPAQPLAERVDGLDPAFGAAIDKCLSIEPAARPASALSLLAELPQGDALAAAVAVGETPSPELVAAARPRTILSGRGAHGLLAAFSVALLAAGWTYDRWHPVGGATLTKAPLVLEDRAIEIEQSLGWDSAANRESGLQVDFDYFQFLRESADPELWKGLRSNDSPAFDFWSRQGEAPLRPRYPAWSTTFSDPPLAAGMSRIRLDTRGRLVSFERVPNPLELLAVPAPNPQELLTSSADRPAWLETALEAAGLGGAVLEEVDSSEKGFAAAPVAYADEVRMWRTTPLSMESPILIETASRGDRPVHFRVRRSWEPRPGKPSASGSLPQLRGTFVSISVLVLLLAIPLVHRNLVTGRGDRRGALRLAMTLGSIHFVLWLLSFIPGRSVVEAAVRLPEVGAHSLWLSVVLWITYLALEPSLRRRQPEILVSWTRLLAGRFTDVLVARDILLGATFGLGATAIHLIVENISMESGRFTPVNDDLWISSVASLRGTIETFDNLLFHTVANSLGVAFLFLVFYMIVRRRLPAILLHGALFTFLSLATFGTVSNPGYYLVSLVFASTMILLLVRVGLLSLVAFWYFAFLATKFPLTTDLTTWYLPSAILTWILALTPALWAYRCLATAGRVGPPRRRR